MNKKAETHVKLKVPKKIWDRFKIKAIIKGQTYSELLLELIKKEVQ